MSRQRRLSVFRVSPRRRVRPRVLPIGLRRSRSLTGSRELDGQSARDIHLPIAEDSKLGFSAIMDHQFQHSSRHHRVTAMFEGHQQSFDLAPGATLVQLTACLARLASQNHAWPVSVSVLIDATTKPASMEAPSAVVPDGRLR